MKKLMKKGIAIAAILVSMIAAPLTAQVFLQREKGDIAPRGAKGDANQEWIIVPVQGVDIDQFAAAPLGSGALLLAGMAGAYAFAKRKKRQ